MFKSLKIITDSISSKSVGLILKTWFVSVLENLSLSSDISTASSLVLHSGWMCFLIASCDNRCLFRVGFDTEFSVLCGLVMISLGFMFGLTEASAISLSLSASGEFRLVTPGNVRWEGGGAWIYRGDWGSFLDVMMISLGLWIGFTGTWNLSGRKSRGDCNCNSLGLCWGRCVCSERTGFLKIWSSSSWLFWCCQGRG